MSKPGIIKAGDQFQTNNGLCKVIKYDNARSVLIEFDTTKYQTVCRAGNLRNGKVKDLLLPTVFDHGIIGVGSYSETATPLIYAKWNSVMRRAFSAHLKKNRPTYIDCTASKKCCNLQTFGRWWIHSTGEDDFEVDEDLMVPKNKIYRLDRMLKIPQEINTLTNRLNKRGHYPLFVHLKGQKYSCRVHIDGKQKYFGVYQTAGEAFEVGKKVKENQAKILAKRWQSRIDPRAYTALMDYTVNIDD